MKTAFLVSFLLRYYFLFVFQFEILIASSSGRRLVLLVVLLHDNGRGTGLEDGYYSSDSVRSATCTAPAADLTADMRTTV